ncbi:hypothetical protein [uncultured Methylobacterium sp.]|uniref:hypothetical protein n=1 Tax=uncultured Methylobacterium sp. TaxID=157278 RepID=UPI0035CAD923
MAPSETRNSGTAATGEMSLPSSNRAETADARTSVSTQRGNGEATQPSRSDATTTWMKSKFEEARPANARFQIGSGRTQAEPSRNAAPTSDAGEAETAHYNNVDAADVETPHYNNVDAAEVETPHYNNVDAAEVETPHYNNVDAAEVETPHYNNVDATEVETPHYNNVDAAEVETPHYNNVTAESLQRPRSNAFSHSAPADDTAMLTNGYIRA